MGRKSKISRLEADIRDLIAELNAGGHTIEEIRAQLQPLMRPQDLPSWSGLQRHVQGLNKLAEKVNRSRAIAEALVRKLGDAPESRQARLNIELMHSILTEFALAQADNEIDGQPVTLDPKDIQFLAKALHHLSMAARADVQTTLDLREAANSDRDEKQSEPLPGEETIFDIPDGRS